MGDKYNERISNSTERNYGKYKRTSPTSDSHEIKNFNRIPDCSNITNGKSEQNFELIKFFDVSSQEESVRAQIQPEEKLAKIGSVNFLVSAPFFVIQI